MNIKSNLKKELPSKLGWFIFFVFAIPLFTYSLNSVLTGYRIDSGITDFSITAHSDCKRVTNASLLDYFIPTKESVEWGSFQLNKPADTTIEPCVTYANTVRFRLGGGAEPFSSDSTYYPKGRYPHRSLPLYAGASNRLQFCNSLGFDTVQSYVGRSYSSPGDNNQVLWESGEWNIVGGSNPGNSHTVDITCTDRNTVYKKITPGLELRSILQALGATTFYYGQYGHTPVAGPLSPMGGNVTQFENLTNEILSVSNTTLSAICEYAGYNSLYGEIVVSGLSPSPFFGANNDLVYLDISNPNSSSWTRTFAIHDGTNWSATAFNPPILPSHLHFGPQPMNEHIVRDFHPVSVGSITCQYDI